MEITDGQSNTILVGEKHLTAAEMLDATNVGNDGHAYNGDKGHSLRNMSNSIARDVKTAANAFGSWHTGGSCNFLFADGSIHSIRPSVSQTTQRQLANRMDGQNPAGYD